VKKNAFLTMTAVVIIPLTIAACGRGAASEDASAEEAVNLTPDSEIPALRPSVRPAESGAGRRTTPGRQALDRQDEQRYLTIFTPKSQVVVLNRVPGMVNELNVEEGDRVSAGNVLASIDRESYKLRAGRAAAEADRSRAIYQRNLEASGEEARIRIVSALELDVSRAEYRQAQADSALAFIELGYTDITAPISGHLIERRIQAGQWIGMQEECFTIADLDVLWAVFTIPQSHVAELETDQPVRLNVDPDSSNPQQVWGTLQLISPVVDPGGGVKITVEVREAGLRSGMTVELELR